MNTISYQLHELLKGSKLRSLIPHFQYASMVRLPVRPKIAEVCRMIARVERIKKAINNPKHK